jgi:hypothetical protein
MQREQKQVGVAAGLCVGAGGTEVGGVGRMVAEHCAYP